jgi:hypothetical protein
MPSVHGFPTAADPEDRHRQPKPLLRIRLSSCLLLVVSHSLARLDSHKAGQRLASAPPWRCFPGVRRHLQLPRPTADPYVPFLPIFCTCNTPASLSRECMRVFNREKTLYRTSRAGDLSDGVRILCFPKPSVRGFPIDADHADRSCRYLV